MVPLTDAVVEFHAAGGPVQETVDVVVVNRDLVDWVRRTAPIAVPDPATTRTRFDRASG
jgi:hypothetical protein